MNEAAALAALADIELPAPPDWRPLIAFALAMLLIMTGATIAYIRKKHRLHTPSTHTPAARESGDHTRHQAGSVARARLEQLQQEWSSGAIDARAAAYRLGTLLRLGLGLPQLQPSAPPAGLNTDEWRETLTLLHGLRYAQTPAQTLTADIFARARRWLSDCEPRNEAHNV